MFSSGLLHMDTLVLTDQENYIHQLCADTGYRQENLPSAKADRDE